MIPQHGHCQMCGKAIKYGETVCSDKCQEEYEKYLKKRKMYIYIMYIALAFLLVMMFLQIM
ncbi:MAG: DUF2116 family Zn-ribbon domain-containing protein [Thermoplasmata archaeon]|nr:MAG: DUF2116 family Zn-ribbon domain-containing protein [Thermoplasmata archaeon]RLF33618.1 MAG: DUF2116 family Zn-ribbon domain-containing protein [Thermoplasmata archaeon]RLF41328.1 MAG: DUF2116 family Zn-ribbon domain-containing protein [Thermoplasmata archaeon]HDN50605.1 DUF2116 family Zn-ribbon domain-containing protein [Thermoplasmatales archaeon]